MVEANVTRMAGSYPSLSQGNPVCSSLSNKNDIHRRSPYIPTLLQGRVQAVTFRTEPRCRSFSRESATLITAAS